MSEFVTKDSGKRQEFDTGMVRDTQDGKPRYDLIPSLALERVAMLYARGAEKYGDNNWHKGQPFSRTLASLERHLHQWKQGADQEEDHLAAIAWNALALMFYEETGRYELDDINRPAKITRSIGDLWQNVWEHDVDASKCKTCKCGGDCSGA